MKIKNLILPLAASVLLTGCSSLPEAQIQVARKMILDGRAECVLVRNGSIAAFERGRGVSPLLTVYETRKGDMSGAIVVDKVVGRAAAMIAVLGKVRHVHGEVMSEDAAAYLEKRGITSSHTLLVPRILNRKRDGLCPLEKSVEGFDDPEDGVAALKKKIESFKRKSVK